MTNRIRINEQGQLTETRPVNAIRINGQNKETEHYSNDVIAAQGYLPESPQIKGGWLIPVYADLPEGAKVTADTWERVGNEAIQTVTAYKTKAEQDAEAAAAEVLRKATPIVYDQPFEMPSILLPSVNNGTGYEYFSDDDGTLLAIVAHNSPMKSKEERDALKAAIKASRGAAKASWNANKGQGQLQARIEALEAIVSALVG